MFLTNPTNQPVARQNRRNVEAQLKTAIRRANKTLSKLSIEPISERVTAHSLRRTYAGSSRATTYTSSIVRLNGH